MIRGGSIVVFHERVVICYLAWIPNPGVLCACAVKISRKLNTICISFEDGKELNSFWLNYYFENLKLNFIKNNLVDGLNFSVI